MSWYEPSIEDDKIMDKFKAWLSEQGAQVLAPTNPYELLRFFARNQTHIIYTGKNGVSSGKFAESCFKAFNGGQHVKMGVVKRSKGPGVKWRSALLERDGENCFFCLKHMEEPTVEHLVAIGKGGPDHMDNMALAHKVCNQGAGGLPLIEKIKIRDLAILEEERRMIKREKMVGRRSTDEV